jgi:hypothetical protein
MVTEKSDEFLKDLDKRAELHKDKRSEQMMTSGIVVGKERPIEGSLSKLPISTQAKLGGSMESGPVLKGEKLLPELEDMEKAEQVEAKMALTKAQTELAGVKKQEAGMHIGQMQEARAKALASEQEGMAERAAQGRLTEADKKAIAFAKEHPDAIASKTLLSKINYAVGQETRRRQKELVTAPAKIVKEAVLGKKAKPSKPSAAAAPAPTPAPSVAPSVPVSRTGPSRNKMLTRLAGMTQKDLNAIVAKGDKPSDFQPFGCSKEELEEHKLADKMMLDEIKRNKITQLEGMAAKKFAQAAHDNPVQRFKL